MIKFDNACGSGNNCIGDNGGNIMRLRIAALLCCATALIGAGPDKTGYRYDALGRVTRTCQWITSTAQRAEYAHDAASNRTNYRHLPTTLRIPSGSGFNSPDGRFTLFMAGDGDLVLYQVSPGPLAVLWATNTTNSGAVRADFQADGNLVLYRQDNSVAWALGIKIGFGTPNSDCAKMQLQNDGNLVILNMEGSPVWASDTAGH